jgi:hypothetical protein
VASRGITAVIVDEKDTLVDGGTEEEEEGGAVAATASRLAVAALPRAATLRLLFMITVSSLSSLDLLLASE